MKTTIVVLVVGLFAVGIPALVRYTVQAVRDHRLANTQTPRPASCPSTGAGRGHDLPACHSTGPRGGHYYRADGDWWVCASCGDRAPRRHVEVFDQEATA